VKLNVKKRKFNDPYVLPKMHKFLSLCRP